MVVTKLRHTDMRYRRRGMRRVVGLSILCAREFCMGLKWGIENFHAIGKVKLIKILVISSVNENSEINFKAELPISQSLPIFEITNYLDGS